MEDALFVDKINEIARHHKLRLPVARDGEAPSAEFLTEWVRFLEDCMKKGIALSDERWQRLTLQSRTPHTVFALERDAQAAVDPDFRVGLQLLMGLLGEREPKQNP